MLIKKPGKVRDHLWCLGHEASRIYLLEGREESMIISGGTRYIVPRVISQLEAFGIDKERIKKLLILHSHFDHVGVVPYFKRSYPDLEVYASTRGWKILRMPKAIRTINEFSRVIAERMGVAEAASTKDLEWRDDISGTAVSEGDVLEIGDMTVRIFETPGHSSCSISAYVPQIKALFPSDGGGIPFKQMIVASGNSDYTKFQQSLDKLKDLEVEYLCADHFAHVVGEEAGNYISRSIVSAGERRAKIEEVYNRNRDVDAAAREMVDSFYSENPDYFLTREIFEGIFRQMVRHIAKGMEGKE